MSNRQEPPVIHVVDDDEAVRSSLTLLGEARGWTVCAYASAEDYLSAPPTAPERTQCLVLDLQMPGRNGADLLESLDYAGKQIATIVLTAWPDSELARRARSAGAVKVLSKPFAPADWLRAVEESLRST